MNIGEELIEIPIFLEFIDKHETIHRCTVLTSVNWAYNF